MILYAELNGTMQQIGGTKPDGWVIMHSPRPDGEYVASDSGEWILLRTELEKAKADKVVELDNSAAAAIVDGFKYEVLDSEGNRIQGNGRYYSYKSEDDQSNFADTNLMINNALILGQQDSLPLIKWNSYIVKDDKSTLVRENITYGEFLQLNTFAAFNHKLAILDKVGELKQQVNAATTVKKVETIVW